jgi:hypothetical protein
MIIQDTTGKAEKRWLTLSILGLAIVGILGLLLRSKFLFNIPSLDYNRFLETHGHFAFGGWVTLALMTLMIHRLLPDALNKKRIYSWLLGGIAVSSWGMLFTFPLEGYHSLADLFSVVFILSTYWFSWVFIRDIQKAAVSKSVRLLVVSGLICLVLSSSGSFALAWLFATKSLNAILYRNALFTYLHLNYNGFFTLSVFAILFHMLRTTMSEKAKVNTDRFTLFLSLSVIPSLFLTYLWGEPSVVIWSIAALGSLLVFYTFLLFIRSARSLITNYRSEAAMIRYLVVLSLSAFTLKLILQSFSIFPAVGKAVFGDRPIIIGFLHLVFLGFVSLFLLAYFAEVGILNVKSIFTKAALYVFTCGVILNEFFLMTQGLAAMFLKSSYLSSWMVWGASIILATGAVMILIARIRCSGKDSLSL